jgi:hypothetical protein
MTGLVVAGVTVDLDADKLRAIADRLTVASGSLDAIAAAADEAATELRRLAEGFDLLREAARQEREAAAAAFAGFRQVFRCDCDSCRLERGETVEETKPRLDS